MAELRLRGDDVQFRLTVAGIIQRTFTAVESLEWIIDSDIIEKGYLGEQQNRYDEIYKGTSLNSTLDVESRESFDLMNTIAQRARRRTARDFVQINGIWIANLPDGTRPRVVIPDLKFANPSLNMPSREAYVAQRITAKASSFRVAGV